MNKVHHQKFLHSAPTNGHDLKPLHLDTIKDDMYFALLSITSNYLYYCIISH